MEHKRLYDDLIVSLENQKTIFEKCLILNPVENIPSKEFLNPSTSFLHGLYGSDSVRENDQKIDTKIQFSKRDSIAIDLNDIYEVWADLLKAEELSMRLLSGLHAHIVIFMSLAKPGDKIVLLPEIAGGHMSTQKILERLGLEISHFKIDPANQCVDIEKSIEIIDITKPEFIFVDRSEGLYYEDFSWLARFKDSLKVFDASQYLTNIMAGDYHNPFDMGFDIILSTLHKNLPGPQRALVCTNKKDDNWQTLKSNMSVYVSNMHVYTIYSAGLMLRDWESLAFLSKKMLENTLMLETELSSLKVPVVRRLSTRLHTHHLWIPFKDKKKAFNFYLDLERHGLLVNYRLLPYNIGYGIRMGTSAATYSGLRAKHMKKLAHYISMIYKSGYCSSQTEEIGTFIQSIKNE